MFQQFTALAAAAILAAPLSAQPTTNAQPKPDAPVREKGQLGIGDKAPALSVEAWIKGDPVKEFQPGQLYIVEFWATWCYPCRESIPHLSQLQREFKGQGVTVIGIAASEHGSSEDEKLGALEKFVKGKGDGMDYRVAFDPQHRAGDAWLKASGIGTIPTAFLIGKDGKIAWIGHPMNGLDAALRTAMAKSDKKKHTEKPGASAGAPTLWLVSQPEQPAAQPEKPKAEKAPKASKKVEEQAAAEPVKVVIGDKAPALTLGKWLKGDKFDKFNPGQVYVVEFWATWCPVCRKSIPHITELQKNYADKVRFLGVSIWENDDKAVAPFVKQKGDEMNYAVAADDTASGDGKMATAWMDAAGQNTIPTAFIINGEGRIAWIGHPNDAAGTLPKVLDQVLKGTWDFAKEAAAQKQQAELGSKLQPALRKLRLARGTNDIDGQLAAIDDALAIDPAVMDPDPLMPFPLAAEKFRLLLTEKDDPEKAYAYGKEAVDGPLKNSAEGLNMVAWTIVDPEGPDLKKRDLDFALKAAQRAMELTDNKDGMIADTVAKVYHDKGDLPKALELQEQAVKLIDNGTFKGSPEALNSIREELKEPLEEYRDESKKNGG